MLRRGLIACVFMSLTTLCHASTYLGTVTRDYGLGQDQMTNVPAARHFVDRVQVFETDLAGDTISLASIAFATLDQIDVTIRYRAINQTALNGLIQERWRLRILGSIDDPLAVGGNIKDDYRFTLDQNISSTEWTTSTFTILATDDNLTVDPVTGLVGPDAFTQTATNKQLRLALREVSALANSAFQVDDISVALYGTAPVPVPASGVLLVGGLAGLALTRRARSRTGGQAQS